MIQMQSVTRIYENGGIVAVDRVSLEIRKAERIALRGPSGAGKSTLLNLIGAIEQPTSGSIVVDGQRLQDLQRLHRFRADTVGFVFQSHHLLPHLTARENVEIPLFCHNHTSRYRYRKANELLDSVGIGERRDLMPGQLSGGERQRVAIARALVNNPRLVLADEPTGNLDATASALVMDLLTGYCDRQQGTLIVATHNETVANALDRTLFMRFGRIED